ncbi:hypothetical protein BD410DRAFT_565551 [Rickenella mellea]|uniref:Uncharacterized protein n=1 Tax=Rickenella mellea TaxID=50990 RepID=A0A4Y7QEI7_9AGAM|nr:hypothetical protein BD410DRAFT_565551 [Rickenella mellea]
MIQSVRNMGRDEIKINAERWLEILHFLHYRRVKAFSAKVHQADSMMARCIRSDVRVNFCVYTATVVLFALGASLACSKLGVRNCQMRGAFAVLLSGQYLHKEEEWYGSISHYLHQVQVEEYRRGGQNVRTT